jgi:hypothetical protein
MRSNRHLYKPLSILVLFLALNTICNATTSAAFLKIPNGAREVAMGETGVSHAVGGNAAWWNPALIGSGERELAFQTFWWLGDGRGSFGSARFPTKWGGIGGYYFYLGMDGFEARDIPGPPQALFSVRQATLALGGTININDEFRAGLVTKTYLEDIYGDRVTNSAIFDIGVIWQRHLWSAGMTLSNFQFTQKTADGIPQTWRAGISRSQSINDFRVSGALEGSVTKTENPKAHLGIEGAWQEKVFGRIGWVGGDENEHLTYGIGTIIGFYRLDIAFTPFNMGLGSVWRLGLGFKI